MNALEHLLSCSACGEEFELPEKCDKCLVRPISSMRTDTPVCQPYHSGVISMSEITVPPPPSLPHLQTLETLLAHQKRGFKKTVARLRALEDGPEEKRRAFRRGIILGIGVALIFGHFVVRLWP